VWVRFPLPALIFRRLALRVSPRRSRTWAFAYPAGGRPPQWMTLGTYPAADAVAILIAVGLVSAFMPALRAARMDPLEALRHE